MRIWWSLASNTPSLRSIDAEFANAAPVADRLSVPEYVVSRIVPVENDFRATKKTRELRA